MGRLKEIKAKHESKYPLGDEKERGIVEQDIDWLVAQAEKVERLEEEKQRINNIVNKGLLNYDITVLEDIRNITD